MARPKNPIPQHHSHIRFPKPLWDRFAKFAQNEATSVRDLIVRSMKEFADKKKF